MYYLQDYLWFLGALVVCMIFSGFAAARVRSSFAKNDKQRCSSGLSGYNVATRLLRNRGATNISVGRVRGFLSDHYHPARLVVNLSDSTYDSNSIAAVAVAAHEIGHVMQKKDGYFLYRVRTAIVPIVNFGSFLAMPLVLVGLIMDMSIAATGESVGFYIAMVGVALYGGSLLFALVTLPVELNASRRAAEMLLDEGIIMGHELPAVREVLSAAALTYLASLLTSLVYFLRFLLQVLVIFGRRSDRR